MKRKNASPVLFFKRISWCGSRGSGEGERKDKSTAALSQSEGERPAVCAERLSELNNQPEC